MKYGGFYGFYHGFTMVLPWKDRDSAGEGSQLSTFFHAIPPWPRRPVASRATKMHWVKSFLGDAKDGGVSHMAQTDWFLFQ